jgi:hypothetical protein
MEAARIFVGFDQREAAAYHVFCQSVISRASIPVSFHPIAKNMLDGFDGQADGSNAFTVSRYLVPLMCDFNGWAIFADGDMVCDTDIAQLWAQRPLHNAVVLVKHDYKTKSARKYMGTAMDAPNVDYPRKNWSSLLIWNCAHYANRVLTKEYVQKAPSAFLHRFQWLEDTAIGTVFAGWNYLVGEEAPSSAAVYHYTCGIPGIKHYADCHASWHWHKELLTALECAGEDPVKIVQRAQERIGAIR